MLLQVYDGRAIIKTTSAHTTGTTMTSKFIRRKAAVCLTHVMIQWHSFADGLFSLWMSAWNVNLPLLFSKIAANSKRIHRIVLKEMRTSQRWTFELLYLPSSCRFPQRRTSHFLSNRKHRWILDFLASIVVVKDFIERIDINIRKPGDPDDLTKPGRSKRAPHGQQWSDISPECFNRTLKCTSGENWIFVRMKIPRCVVYLSLSFSFCLALFLSLATIGDRLGRIARLYRSFYFFYYLLFSI